MKNTTKLSDLCKLSQTDDKTEREFWQILSFLAPREMTEQNRRAQQPKESPLCLRADTVEKSLEKSEVLALAPRQENGFVVIPPVLEEA